MSQLPPTLDAILASIRSRMTEGDDAPAPPMPAPEAILAAPTIAPATEDLGEMVVTGQATTLEEVVRSMLEPMLKSWLDANMPEIVERMAQAEINRLTGRT
jgi:cell pole-organizing protein PopZ